MMVRITDPGSEPETIQGRVREVVRELASALRPDLPFPDSGSARQGWRFEGVAGSGGVGARAYFDEGERSFSLTIRAIFLDEAANEQEWLVQPSLDGPTLTDAGRQRGSLIVIAGIHGGVFGALAFYFFTQPYIGTTSSVLALGLAIPVGMATAAFANRFTPPAPPPPDLSEAQDAWSEEVRAALTGHSALKLTSDAS